MRDHCEGNILVLAFGGLILLCVYSYVRSACVRKTTHRMFLSPVGSNIESEVRRS
jgi:hypothetical protein